MGDNSLNKRSMKNLIELMSKFGAFFYQKINSNFFKDDFFRSPRWNKL